MGFLSFGKGDFSISCFMNSRANNNKKSQHQPSLQLTQNVPLALPNLCNSSETVPLVQLPVPERGVSR